MVWNGQKWINWGQGKWSQNSQDGWHSQSKYVGRAKPKKPRPYVCCPNENCTRWEFVDRKIWVCPKCGEPFPTEPYQDDMPVVEEEHKEPLRALVHWLAQQDMGNGQIRSLHSTVTDMLGASAQVRSSPPDDPAATYRLAQVRATAAEQAHRKSMLASEKLAKLLAEHKKKGQDLETQLGEAKQKLVACQDELRDAHASLRDLDPAAAVVLKPRPASPAGGVASSGMDSSQIGWLCTSKLLEILNPGGQAFSAPKMPAAPPFFGSPDVTVAGKDDPELVAASVEINDAIKRYHEKRQCKEREAALIQSQTDIDADMLSQHQDDAAKAEEKAAHEQRELQRADAAKRQLEEADSLRVQTEEAAQQKAKAARTQQSGGGTQAMDSEESLPADGKGGQESTLPPP